jgi:hypothetical protein
MKKTGCCAPAADFRCPLTNWNGRGVITTNNTACRVLVEFDKLTGSQSIRPKSHVSLIFSISAEPLPSLLTGWKPAESKAGSLTAFWRIGSLEDCVDKALCEGEVDAGAKDSRSDHHPKSTVIEDCRELEKR